MRSQRVRHNWVTFTSLGVELLGHQVILYLTFCEITKLFPTAAVAPQNLLLGEGHWTDMLLFEEPSWEDFLNAPIYWALPISIRWTSFFYSHYVDGRVKAPRVENQLGTHSMFVFFLRGVELMSALGKTAACTWPGGWWGGDRVSLGLPIQQPTWSRDPFSIDHALSCSTFSAFQFWKTFHGLGCQLGFSWVEEGAFAATPLKNPSVSSEGY